MRQRLVPVLVAAGSAALCAFAPAAAAASQATPQNELGLAGYHFRVSSSSVTVQGSVTAPKVKCWTRPRRYQLQIGASYSRRGYLDNATVLLKFTCENGVQKPGTAELVAGFNALIPSETIKPGQTLKIKDTVSSRAAKAVLTFPSGKSVWVTAGGGTPVGGAYAMTMSHTRPPIYQPVAFTGCLVNGKPLLTRIRGSGSRSRRRARWTARSLP